MTQKPMLRAEVYARALRASQNRLWCFILRTKLRKRTLSPVRLVLEDSSKRSFMLFVVVSLQL